MLYTEHFDTYAQASDRVGQITINPRKHAAISYLKDSYVVTWGYYA